MKILLFRGKSINTLRPCVLLVVARARSWPRVATVVQQLIGSSEQCDKRTDAVASDDRAYHFITCAKARVIADELSR